MESRGNAQQEAEPVLFCSQIFHTWGHYALFQVDPSLCGGEWTRTKQLSSALSSHPVPPQARIPHSRL